MFGSALSERFDETRSDVDFLVEFADDLTSRFDAYFGLNEGLEVLLGRPVDLVMPSALDNPYFAASVQSLNRLSRADPVTAAGVEDLPRIVAFRNVLVRGYAAIDEVLVWEVATTRIDPLIATLNRLLDETPTV